MAYPRTGSLLTSSKGNNNTGVALSTQILIKVGDVAVGAIQSLSITEARNISMVNELGTDGSIDSAPTGSTVISGSCTRIRFDRLRATEAFGRDFLHIHSQRIPFDISIFDFWQGDGADVITTTIKNVWIDNITYSYSQDNWIITDTFQWKAETMYSTLNGGPAATGGARGGAILSLNAIERAADIGQRRGSMDASGLINDYFLNV